MVNFNQAVRSRINASLVFLYEVFMRTEKCKGGRKGGRKGK
jgi:hypothetical protein